MFDESTVVLTESEAAILLNIMKKLAESGIAIIFITHRLDEVVQVADRVTILRDGEVVATKLVRETDAVSLAQMMVGRSVEQVYNRETPYVWEKMPAVLKLKDFQVNMPGEECRGIDLEVHEGEILGIAGLAGQGKIGVANGIAGIYPSRGYLEIYGKEISKPSPMNCLPRAAHSSRRTAVAGACCWTAPLRATSLSAALLPNTYSSIRRRAWNWFPKRRPEPLRNDL